nr:hypothetical protein [Mucilaginibacter sp. L294]
MKKYLSIFILPFVSTMALAQAPSAVVSIGGGISTTSSALKNEALIGNGYLINTNVFVPFARKGWDGSVKGSGKFALGIIAGTEYNSAKNLLPGVGPTQKMYKLYTGDLNIISDQKGSANSTGFTGLAGLQADFTLGKVTLSPSVSGAYFSLKQDGFTQNSQVMVNGTTQTVVLLESQPIKRTGFVFKPQFKVSYPIAGNLSFYAAGGLNVGPKITTTQSRLVPAGGFTDKNMYEAMQLTTGTRNEQSVVSRYQTIAVTAGISWGFGGGGSESSRRHYRGKVTKPGDGGMRYIGAVEEPLTNAQATTDEHRTYTGGRRVETSALVAGQPIKGVIVKGGKNPGENMIGVVANNNGEIELKGLEAGDYKFTVIAPEEPAGKSISEKGVSSTKGRPKNMVFSPGNPIGGIIVKGGKNPGGSMMVITTNDNGEFELNGIEAGDYKFTVTAPEPSNAEATTDEHRTYTGGRRVETSALAAGNPIGGIIVKGGKNPGGSMIAVVTDNNGVIELKGLEVGDYKFTITAPEQPAGKSINEKGIKRSEDAASNRLSMTPTSTKQTQGANFGEKVASGLQSGAGAVSQGASKSISEKGVSSTKGRPKNMVFSPGSPIGGVVVKGGKNPGGNMIVITTNDNGEFELNGIEAGDYKFTVTAPEQPSGRSISEKGVKRN